MKTLYKTTIFILFSVICFNAEAKNRKGKYTEEKHISNQYEVNDHFNLMVDNRYGEVRIETWNKNEVSYEIKIISNGDHLDKVKKRLEGIEISKEESKSKLSLVTRFRDNKNGNHSTFTSLVKSLFNGENMSHNAHIEVNYIIHLPKQAHLDITNDYGFIYIDETKGDTRLNSDYGGVYADALLSSHNEINLNYSSKSDITHLKQAEMNIAYSSINLHHVGFLNLSADYCTTKIDSIKDIDFSVDYGALSINKGRKIEGSADYVQVKLGEIKELVDVDLSYGGLKINRIMTGFTYANIRTDYATTKVGIDYSEAFILNIKTSYANMKGIQDFNTINSSDNYYKGYNKNSKATKHITIDADYGSVSIFPSN